MDHTSNVGAHNRKHKPEPRVLTTINADPSSCIHPFTLGSDMHSNALQCSACCQPTCHAVYEEIISNSSVDQLVCGVWTGQSAAGTFQFDSLQPDMSWSLLADARQKGAARSRPLLGKHLDHEVCMCIVLQYASETD